MDPPRKTGPRGNKSTDQQLLWIYSWWPQMLQWVFLWSSVDGRVAVSWSLVLEKKKTEREESTYSTKPDSGTTVPVKMIWLLPHHPTLINWLWLQILESLKISSCFSQIWVEFPFAIRTMVLPIFKFTAPAVGELRKSKSDQRASRMENACIPPASCLHNCSNGRAMSKAIETASAQPVCL